MRPPSYLSLPALLVAAAVAQSGPPDCTGGRTTASGLQFCVLQKGRAEPGPGPDDMVEVHYTGWLTNGRKFDSTRERGLPLTMPVGGFVKGWTEGLQLMTPGMRARLQMPPALAYGDQEQGDIPPNSTLVFEVELLRVLHLPRFKPPAAQQQRTTPSGLVWEYLQHGTGAQVGELDFASFRYAVFSTKGALQDCSELQQDHRMFGTRASLPFPFLRELVTDLRVGDVVRCEVPARLGNGRNPIGKLPAGSDTVWELELVGVHGVPKFKRPDPKQLVTTDSGLQYEVVRAGQGKRPVARGTVLVHYTGWLEDGRMFDSTHARGEPMQMRLENVIRGWAEGLQLMQEGGAFWFVVPPELGYGSAGKGDIPSNATLVFYVELVEVKSSDPRGQDARPAGQGK